MSRVLLLGNAETGLEKKAGVSLDARSSPKTNSVLHAFPGLGDRAFGHLFLSSRTVMLFVDGFRGAILECSFIFPHSFAPPRAQSSGLGE
jgi:hypothetical protein